MRRKHEGESLEHKLWMEVLKYVAVGLLGAAVATVVTWFNRLPSRSLTLLPAGIQVRTDPELTCDETGFLSQTVNRYLNDEISVPVCESPLAPTAIAKLISELRGAVQEFKAQRLAYLEPASARLHKLNPDAMADKILAKAVVASVADLEYLSRDLPVQLSGREQFDWAFKNVDDSVATVHMNIDRMEAISQRLNGKANGPSLRHVELFFLATNTSDVEFYFPTRCSVKIGESDYEVRIEQLGESRLPIGSMRYVPLLPGRGQAIRFGPFGSADHAAMDAKLADDLSSDRDAHINCQLGDGHQVSSTVFRPRLFLVSQ